MMDFGFTQNEAKLYLTLLRVGECKVGMLIKESNFKSGKIYQVLDSLARKGLVSFVVKNNVKYCFSQEPKRILDYIRSKKHRLEESEQDFLKYLPDLTKLRAFHKESCDVKVYDSVEGIRSVLFFFMDKIDKDSTVFLYGANDDPKRDIVLLWRKYDELCKDKNIRTKVIMTSISESGRAKRRNNQGNKSYRYLKGTDLSNFMVSKNMVLLFNFDQPSCILIENSAYSRQFINLFSFLWNHAKKL